MTLRNTDVEWLAQVRYVLDEMLALVSRGWLWNAPRRRRG